VTRQRANKPLVPTRKSEALLLAAQRGRWAAKNKNASQRGEL
jgi:hypothetical protein